MLTLESISIYICILDHNSLVLFNCRGIWGSIRKMLRSFTGPKYDGKYFNWLVRDKLGETKLHNTLSHVVIPTFDIKRLQPTIFSTYEVISLITHTL